jgi:rhamnosyltransferase
MKNTVAVLLATFNGLRWLPEQVDSIFNQTEVNIRLIISDDMSTDGTWNWLQELASRDSRVLLLPQIRKFGSAAANFYRLVIDAELGDCDFVAFSDQDDIWVPDKLFRHIDLSNKTGAEGVSSNVIAFWENNYSVELNKSQPQRKLDYLFESPGPGCTYLMTPWLVNKLRSLLVDPVSNAREVVFHDWLAYAVCRASGRTWYIDDIPSVKYRQHHANEFGANHGATARIARINKLFDNWYRKEIIKILDICMMLSNEPDYIQVSRLLRQKNLINQYILLRYVNWARRRFVDRMVLAMAITLYIF